MPSETLSTRVTMPPSNFGARASIATQCPCFASLTGLAPAASSSLRTLPMLYGVPRQRKLSAASPQASRSQAKFDSKPPAAATSARARTSCPTPWHSTVALRKCAPSMARSTASVSYAICTPSDSATR